MTDPLYDLQTWLSKACSWAEAQEKSSLAAGRPLTDSEADFARRVGVAHPEGIRVHVVEDFPRPHDPQLRAIADQMGFFSAGMIGLTLRYAVLIADGHENSERLLRHEFRHVHQYEAAGSIENFLSAYFSQLIEVGYRDAPLEIDARAYEVDSR